MNWQQSIHYICNDNKILSWLTYKDSMTAAMRKLASGNLSIEVLKQGLIENNWQRETLLFIDQKPCMYAISHFPEKTFNQCRDQLTQLQQKFLGETLIDKASFEKRNFVFAKIKTPDESLKNIAQFIMPEKICYLRQSTLTAQNFPFTLTEFFLPELLELIT